MVTEAGSRLFAVEVYHTHRNLSAQPRLRQRSLDGTSPPGTAESVSSIGMPQAERISSTTAWYFVPRPG